MADPSLLPPSATNQERAIVNSLARLSDVPVPIRSLYNAETCPVELLPWLAWAYSVGEWDSNWPESTKRAVIASSVAVHRIKGTPASIKMALAAAGYPNAEVVEGAGAWMLDGSRNLDGTSYLGDSDGTKWAWYRVKLANPIANSQVEQVKRILANTAPARCYLEALDFTEAAFILNGTVKLDGTYNLGTVD